MSKALNIHWTEDEELLEQFVLGRLSPTEVAKLEKHLQECDTCRSTVATERDLVAGIRLAGRETVKHRLAQRLELQKTHGANWYRVVGVAAGIVLLVTVGIYNRWFMGTETRMEKPNRADRTEDRTEPISPASPEKQVIVAEKPAADAARRASDEENQKVQNLTSGVSKSTGAAGQIAEAQVDKLKNLKGAEGGREGESREKKDRFAAAPEASRIAGTWLEGALIPERDQNAPAAMEIAANAKDERNVLRKEKGENQLDKKAARVIAGGKADQNFIIAQKLLSDLPPSQRTRQQNTVSVQALLQKNPTGTHITVFLDSLLTKKELDQTRVQSIGEDSIILNLGNRLVGYKLPPEWTGQGIPQTKKEK